MTPKERAERVLWHILVAPPMKTELLEFAEMEIAEAEREAVRDFVRRVVANAESAEGACYKGNYYIAMQREQIANLVEELATLEESK